MTLGELRSDFKLFSGEDFSSSEELQIINKGLQYLYSELLNNGRYKTLYHKTTELTFGETGEVSLPTDFLEYVRLSDDSKLSISNRNLFLNSDFEIKDGKIKLNSEEDFGERFFLHYMPVIPNLTTDNDVPAIDIKFHSAITESVLYIYHKRDRNMPEMANQVQLIKLEITKNL